MADEAPKPSSDTDGDDQMHGFLTRAMREADGDPRSRWSASMRPWRLMGAMWLARGASKEKSQTLTGRASA